MSLEVASQHVIYRGTDGHIHLVLYESGTEHWRHVDVSDKAGATGFPPAGNPAAFAIAGVSQHVVYRGTDGHIHMALYESSTGLWRHVDVTAKASATGFLCAGDPAAFVIAGVSQHVAYRGTDGHIHIVLYESSTGLWRHVDVSDEASATGFPPAGDPAAFTVAGKSQHVVYRGTDFRIHMLLYEDSTGHWRHVDVSNKASATGFLSSGDPAAFAITGKSQHVVYRGTEGHIHMLLYEDTTGHWRHVDVSDKAGATGFPPAPGAPAAFAIANKSQHVVYRGADGHIHMVLYESSTGHWRHVDVSDKAGATGFPCAGDPAAFVIVGVSQHVAYRGTAGHIHMVLYEDSTEHWRHVDVSDEAGATGFPPAEEPACYVFEVEKNGGFWEGLWNGLTGAWDGFWGGVSSLWEFAGWLLTPVGFIVNLVLTIPVLGGLIRGLLNTITGVVLGIVGFVIEGILCGIFGVCLPKRMRLCVVMLTRNGQPLMTESELEKSLLQQTKQIFTDEANIEIVSRFTIYKGGEGTRAMNAPCGVQGWLEDAVGVMGTQYHIATTLSCVRWGTASVIGLGSPIYAFGVNDVRGKNGCSLWLWSNYVVFEASAADCTTHLAHEIGHACGLWHQDDTENLMYPKCVSPGRDQLKGWQKVIVRGSKYATYW